MSYDKLNLMIVTIGTRSSKAYEIAKQCALDGCSVSLLAGVENSDEGRAFLETLIDNLIMFDPLFCNASDPENVFTEENLLMSFSSNTDIHAVYVDCAYTGNSHVMRAVRSLGVKVICGTQTDDILSVASMLREEDEKI